MIQGTMSLALSEEALSVQEEQNKADPQYAFWQAPDPYRPLHGAAEHHSATLPSAPQPFMVSVIA
jgi:hypothetical protein